MGHTGTVGRGSSTFVRGAERVDQPQDEQRSASDTNGGGGPAASTGPAADTRFDTIIGKLVVESGLATPDDLKDVLERQAGEDAKNKTLTQLLIDEQIVTRRQLDRLRAQAEAERKHQQIPGYKLLGKLGAGAMAVVYKAKQISLDRMVAIKILPRKFSTNPQFIERFYAEGRAAAALNHPNIVQAIDVGQAGEFHYFVMEYVDGETVHDQIVENKRFSEEEAVEVALATAEALQHAHMKGLIHRDVKPKNIMMTSTGLVKLADLGLARAISDKEAAEAEKGKAYGTPYYISPEQIRGDVNVEGRADIYSLGATLYHMLTGTVPYNGKDPQEVMKQHIKAELVPPDHVNPKLSAGISEVVERMMMKGVEDRYEDAGQLITDLRAVRRGEQPPIAHKEIGLSAFAQAAAAERESTGEVATDSMVHEQASPFNDLRVQGMLFGLVFVTLWALIATVVAFL